MLRAVLLLLLAANSGLATAPAAERFGPGLAGSWYDFMRGLWLVLEPTGADYRVYPVLLERTADGRLVNRFDGMVLPGKSRRGVLGFGGEGSPSGDPERRRWRIEGSVRLSETAERLDGEIRVEAAPYVEPPRPSQRIELHRHDRNPTLSVLTANRPEPPARTMPAAESDRSMAVSVDVQYLPVKTDVEQADADPPVDIDPRRTPLTTNIQGWWQLNRNAVW